jgi:cellulose synthase/poly-beta-1,6-N-acetylglucosamine synthase-like glycosyltransferase
MDIVAKLLFFISVGVILYVYAGYPIVLFFLGLFKRRRKPGPDELEEYPSVALIISVYNEEKIIKEKIENSLKLDYPKDKLRIVIASDGSKDETDRIVKDYEGGNIVLKSFDMREGKSATLNRTRIFSYSPTRMHSTRKMLSRCSCATSSMKKWDARSDGSST